MLLPPRSRDESSAFFDIVASICFLSTGQLHSDFAQRCIGANKICMQVVRYVDHLCEHMYVGKPGSAAANGTWVANNTFGHPASWRLTINPSDGSLVRTLVPTNGLTADLFSDRRYLSPVPMLNVARAQNPDDGLPPSTPHGSWQRKAQWF